MAKDPNTVFPGANPQEWNAHAKQYAAMPFQGPMSLPAKMILAGLDSVSPISQATAMLDVGCGPGMVIHQLASIYGTVLPSTARVIASDFSAGMVECCEEKKAQRAGTDEDVGGVWSRLETAVYDAQDLSAVKNGEMSHISAAMVYFMLPSPQKGFQEAYRVLKDGGAIALSSFHQVEWSDLMYEAAKSVREDAPRGFTIEKMGNLATTEGVKEELEAVGFKNVKSEYVDIDMPMQNPTMFVNGFIRSNNPGALSILGDFTPEEIDRVCVKFLELVEGKSFLHGVMIIASGMK